eukprot:2130230-Amphidinium_carterae.1
MHWRQFSWQCSNDVSMEVGGSDAANLAELVFLGGLPFVVRTSILCETLTPCNHEASCCLNMCDPLLLERIILPTQFALFVARCGICGEQSLRPQGAQLLLREQPFP